MRSSRGSVGAALTTTLILVAANVSGSAAVRAPAQGPLPAFDHVFVVVEENHNYSEIIGNPQAPYINGLASQNGLAVQYSGVSHPSLPNYLALTGGSTYGVTTDCAPTACPIGAPNIADRIEGAGKTWKAYMDAMPSACGTSSSGTYAVRHDPFVYYNDIRNDPARCSNHVVPYQNLATDLASVSTTPNFAWITPDVCNDMHDCQVSIGDSWLKNNLPAIFRSPAWTTQKSVLLLTWDEGSTNHVATLVIGPSVGPGYQSPVAYDHYSLLKTVESAWSLAPLTSNDTNASPMNDFFLGAIGASPATVNPGGSVTTTWSGIITPTAGDWIGLYSVGSPDSAYLSYRYTGGTASGSGPLGIPVSLSPGTYELRLFPNYSGTHMATSGPITVQGVSLSAPSTISPGAPVMATWSGVVSPEAGDWIGLYSVGSPDSAYLSYRYTGGTASGSVPLSIPASLSAGSYELRLFPNYSSTHIAISGPLTLQGITLSASPGTMIPGGSVTATWSGIGTPTAGDWIGLYSAGSADGAYLSYRYTGGTASGSVPFSVPASLRPGTYELRLFPNYRSTHIAISGPLTVQGVALNASPSTMNPGGSVTATWSGIGTPTAGDWIGLYSAGSADGAYLSYRYTGGTASGSVPFSVPASLRSGTYELRLFPNYRSTHIAVSGPLTVP